MSIGASTIFARTVPAAGRAFSCLALTVLTVAAEDAAVCPVPKLSLPDPAAEGWTSEAFADAAQAELKRLLASLKDPAAKPAELRGLFALRPELTEVKSSSVTVHRGGTAKLPAKPAPLAAALQPLRALFLRDAELKLLVKTVGVTVPEKKSGAARTTHLVHLSGPSARGRREMNATWTAQWTLHDGNPATLDSLVCEKWEDVESAAAKPWFSDQTAVVLESNPQVAEQLSAGNSYYRLRIQASLPFFKFGHHGIAIADVNGDGWDDVYACQPGGLPNRLLLHQPDNTVKDAAAEWGIDFLDSTQCALFADFDNDGDPDLALATTGALNFFENTGRKFERRLRLPPVLNAYGLAAADYDLDGDMDVYAVRYFPSAGEGGELAVPVPQFDANNGGPNFLIRNDGPAAPNWIAFSDATAATGLDVNNHRFSYAAVWDDFNNDGRTDLYVANDYGRNNLYLQEAGPDGKPHFRDATESAGLMEGAFGMSASSGDFNRDGWGDIHLGAMWSSAGNRITAQERFRPEVSANIRERFQRLARGNTLFLNNAKPAGSFTDVSNTAGITVGRWSWASLFADIDNDAWPDLLVGNGFVTGEIPDDL